MSAPSFNAPGAAFDGPHRRRLLAGDLVAGIDYIWRCVGHNDFRYETPTKVTASVAWPEVMMVVQFPDGDLVHYGRDQVVMVATTEAIALAWNAEHAGVAPTDFCPGCIAARRRPAPEPSPSRRAEDSVDIDAEIDRVFIGEVAS